jgi:hypothetical protein
VFNDEIIWHPALQLVPALVPPHFAPRAPVSATVLHSFMRVLGRSKILAVRMHSLVHGTVHRT